MSYHPVVHAPDPYRANHPRCNANAPTVTTIDGTYPTATCRRCLSIGAPDYVGALIMSVINWHNGYLYTDQLHAAIDRYLTGTA